MAGEYCLGALCFVPLQEPSPDIFGLSEFLTGLALMVLAWARSDARYRFRVASAAVKVYSLTYRVVAVIGVLILLTELWHAQNWLVPRGPFLTPATWQILLGGTLVTTFLGWAWLAFFHPPVFRPRNAGRFASAFCHAVIRGSDLPLIAEEVERSASDLVRLATDRANRASGNEEIADYEVCANRILLMMADRRFCRAVVESSPTTAIAFFTELSKTRRFGIPIDAFGRNLVSEALKNRDSFMFNEAEGYESGLLGYDKPLTQAIFSDFALVDGVRSLFDLDWKQARQLDPSQWEAYCHALLVAFKSYVDQRAPQHAPVIHGALHNLKHAVEDLHELNGVTGDWNRPTLESLGAVVRFIQDAMRALASGTCHPTARTSIPSSSASRSSRPSFAPLAVAAPRRSGRSSASAWRTSALTNAATMFGTAGTRPPHGHEKRFSRLGGRNCHHATSWSCLRSSSRRSPSSSPSTRSTSRRHENAIRPSTTCAASQTSASSAFATAATSTRVFIAVCARA